MAEEKEKKNGPSMLKVILIICTIIVMIPAIFFAILDGIAGTIVGTVVSIANLFTEDLGTIIDTITGTVSNFVTKIFGGESFSTDAFASETLEPIMIIDLENFTDVSEKLKKSVNTDAIGLDDITMKKMLLTYYRTIYLSGYKIMIEITPEEKDLLEDGTDYIKEPFSIEEGDEDKNGGVDGSYYLVTNGFIKIIDENGDELQCYTENGLKAIYQEYERTRASNPDYAEAVKQALGCCYTLGDKTGKIKMYQINNIEAIREAYSYDVKNGPTERTSETERSYYIYNNYATVDASLREIEYGNAVSSFTTPVEFLVDLMQITGSRDFIDKLMIEIVNNSSIEMKIYNTSSKTVETVEEEYTLGGWVEAFIKGTAIPYTSAYIRDLNNKVIYIKEMINESNRYEFIISEVNSWHCKVDNSTVTVTEENKYYTVDSAGDVVEGTPIEITLTDDSDFIKVEGVTGFEDKDDAFVIVSEDEELYEKHLEQVFNYLKRRPSRANPSGSYDYTMFDFKGFNIKKTGRTSKTTITEYNKELVTSGVPIAQDNTDVFLDLLRDKTTNEPIEYGDVYGGDVKVGDMLVNGDKMLFQLLDTAYTDEEICNTVGLSTVMKYILYRYSGNDYGVTTYDFSILNLNSFNSFSNNGITLLGDSVEAMVWYTLKGAGYSEIAIAGVMGNVWRESGFKTNNLENTYNTKLGYTDEEYTEAVNNGTYSKAKFISDHDIDGCGAGYGLCQWTFFARKQGLYEFAKGRGANIDDPEIQIEFMLGELSLTGGADGKAQCCINGSSHGYNYNSWHDATDVYTATAAFMCIFERPADMSKSEAKLRAAEAQKYYDRFAGKELSGGSHTLDGSGKTYGTFTSNITGRTFTVYHQNSPSIGLRDQCNRAVAATIASGYRGSRSEMDVIYDVKAGGSYILTNMTSTNNFFGKYGLGMQLDEHSYSTDNIRSILSQGKYIAIWLDGTSYGKSGAQYCGGIHWISIIGYKNEGGKEQIFIAEPAYGSTGWKDINELDTCKRNIAHFNVIYEK